MKFFMFSIDDILIVITCFIIVSSQRVLPSENLILSNSSTEFPCNQENGCNFTETTIVNSEILTLNVSNDVTNRTIFTTDQPICSGNECQTEPSSLETETSTNITFSSNFTINYDDIQQNTTTETTPIELFNVSEPIKTYEESTTITTTTIMPDSETMIIMVFNSSELQTTNETVTSTESLINDSTTSPPGNNEINNSSIDDSSSVTTQNDSTSIDSIDINITTIAINSSEINFGNDFTTDMSIETITNDSINYALNHTLTEIFIENINTTFILPDTTTVEQKTTVNDTSITDPELFIKNLTTELITSTEMYENTSFETLTNQTEIIYEKTDENNTDKLNFTIETTNTTIVPDYNSTTDSTKIIPGYNSTTDSTTIIPDYNSTTDSTDIDNKTIFTIHDLPTVTPHRNYLTVEIKVNCSGNEKQEEISSSIAEFLNTSLKDPKDCTILRNITIVVPNEMVEFHKISQFLIERFNTVQLIKIWYNSKNNNKTRDAVTVADEVTEREVILYVSLGVCLGIVLLLAVIITCFKCLRKRSNKPLDLDVPHLNLRLEDYTLTRIPRPNTIYLDYFRGPIINDRYSSAPLSNSVSAANSERGLVQPFDTSVIPLEDAKKLEDLSTPITHNETTCPSTPLRTFGRKDWKNRENLIYENIMSSSTEKLHSDFFKSGNRGEDNPTFAA